MSSYFQVILLSSFGGVLVVFKGFKRYSNGAFHEYSRGSQVVSEGSRTFQSSRVISVGSRSFQRHSRNLLEVSGKCRVVLRDFKGF